MTAYDHWKTTDLDAEDREREECMEAAGEAADREAEEAEGDDDE